MNQVDPANNALKNPQKNEDLLQDQKQDHSNHIQNEIEEDNLVGAPDASKRDQKRTLPELLAEYEKRRIEFEKFQQKDMNEGGDPLMYQSMQRAIKRMSYDYRAKEKKLKDRHRENKDATEKFNEKQLKFT